MKRAAALLYMVVLALSLFTGCGCGAAVSEAGIQKEEVSESASEREKGRLSVPSASADDQNAEDGMPAEGTGGFTGYETARHPDHASKLQMTVLDVGQGLSVLIGSDGEYVLYDGGGRKRSSYVVSYLKHQDIERFKYLFASHYDEDHIAGLTGALRTIPVKEAIIPDYQADTSIYKSFVSALEEAEKVTYAEAGNQYELGDAAITVLYAADGSEKTENDKSTVISVTMGDFTSIITGDAEYGTEERLIQSGVPLSCDVYIVGHHGSASSSSPAFVSAMSPETSIISVGAGNDYGHPSEDTLKVLADNGSTVYRTDLSGEIYVESDGRDYIVTTEDDADGDVHPLGENEDGDVRRLDGNADGDVLQSEESTAGNVRQLYENADGDIPGSEKNADGEVRQSEEITYVLNNNSGKFHRPGCKAISRIAGKNKEYSYESREELIEQGYDPCGWCKP